MKKIFLAFVLLIVNGVIAQESVSSKFLLTTVSDEVGISAINLIDAYLSPLNYIGPGIYYQRTSSKLFSADNNKLSHETKLKISGGFTFNPAQSAGITYTGGLISWGPFYHFKLTDDIFLRAGGNINALAANTNNTRNTNNPMNFDFNTNLNVAGELKYKFHLFKKNLTLYGNFDFPFAGLMFVPRSGISYYQLIELGDFSNTIHLSSFHNRQGLNFYTSLEIPFNYTIWKFGIGSEILTWKANDMIFKHDELKISVAIKYNIKRFSGIKNTAPEDFLSVE